MKQTWSQLFLLAGLLVLVACTGGRTKPGATFLVGAAAPEITYHGRVTTRGDSAVFAWSGTGFSFATEALHLTLSLTDHGQDADGQGQALQGRYAVVVNGKPHATWPAEKGKTDYPVEGLPAGPKEIQVMRLNEPLVSYTVFRGIRTDRPISAVPRQKRPQLEFIGNSITTAYGSAPGSLPCGFSPGTQDFRQSYASLVAAELGADLAVVAWSGRGLARNYDKTTAGAVPALYPYTLPYPDSLRWDFPGPPPDLVLIHLGTNDFAHEIPAKETWVKAYLAFIHRIRQHYPGARFMLLGGPTLQDRPGYPAFSTLQQYLEEVKARARTQGTDVQAYVMPRFEGAGKGCDAHPDSAAHAQMAREITLRLRQHWPELGH